jgi:hypothetical protein
MLPRLQRGTQDTGQREGFGGGPRAPRGPRLSVAVLLVTAFAVCRRRRRRRRRGRGQAVEGVRQVQLRVHGLAEHPVLQLEGLVERFF